MVRIIRPFQVAVLAVLLAGCAKKEVTAEQKRHKAQVSVSIDAWLAAKDHVNASQECRIAGFSPLQKCALNDGLLEPEEIAKDAASRALNSAAEYRASCAEDFSEEFCNELIDRAIRIEWRRVIYGKNTEISPSTHQEF